MEIEVSETHKKIAEKNDYSNYIEIIQMMQAVRRTEIFLKTQL